VRAQAKPIWEIIRPDRSNPIPEKPYLQNDKPLSKNVLDQTTLKIALLND